MKCTKLFEEIEKLNHDYINMWEEFCNIESPTAFKEGVDHSGSYVLAWADKMGFETEVSLQKSAGNAICITMNPDAQGAPICISGHMDTVHPIGLFGTPPVRKDDDKIYGPGVCDCKGGIVAGMLAMEALKNVGFTQRPVRLLLQSDEEVGSRLSNKETINYICAKAEDAEAFLNLEGFKRGCAVIQRKGIVTIEFTVRGVKAHSSACATDGANAIAEAAHKIIEMEKLKDDEGLTCNCGLITGGTVVNTVPDKCVFKANIRFASSKEYDYVLDYAQKVADTIHVPGCSCTTAIVGMRPAMELKEKNINLFEIINRIYRENHLTELETLFARGGSDGAYVTIAGIPCVDSLGVEGGDIHTSDEFAYLKSLKESAKRVASVVYCI